MPIKEYMTMEEVEIKHEKNNAEIASLTKKYDPYQAEVDKKFSLIAENVNNIKNMIKKARDYKCSTNSGPNGDENIKKKYCK